ncbi:MAG TPA: VOC family protein [Streptosporangiaceae bacterium]|nr:VOC family protein [Streptosporangiaceae bacterium]
MAHVARVNSVVMFVHDLDRSVSFYTDVLALDVTDRSATAALLTSGGGTQLILRAMGSNAAHSLGSVGVQYVVWTATGKEDLERCEQALKQRSAYRDTRADEQAMAVEGRDPDDIVVMIAYPGPDQAPLHELPARIYGW